MAESKRYPNPPKPPPSRKIIEGVGHWCEHCGSSRPRSGWLGLFGKRECPNNCIGPYDPSLIKGHGSFLNKSEYTNMDECKKNLYESASKANCNTCVHETPRSNILCTSCLNHNHYEEKPTQTYDCLSGNYPKATFKEFFECFLKNSWLTEFKKWLKYWCTPYNDDIIPQDRSYLQCPWSKPSPPERPKKNKYLQRLRRRRKKRYSISTPIVRK